MTNPSDPDAVVCRSTCPAYGGSLAVLGTLGSLDWFRCIQCGMDVSRQHPKPERDSESRAEAIPVKVLFLDLDGVVNCAASSSRTALRLFGGQVTADPGRDGVGRVVPCLGGRPGSAGARTRHRTGSRNGRSVNQAARPPLIRPVFLTIGL